MGFGQNSEGIPKIQVSSYTINASEHYNAQQGNCG